MGIFVSIFNETLFRDGFSSGAEHQAQNRLMKVEVALVDNRKCREINKQEIMEEMFVCAGRKGRDMCDGDSGGPLVKKVCTNICPVQLLDSFISVPTFL